MVIGLTGNYGMGKSTVLKMFRNLGAVVIDSDRLAGSALNNRGVLKRIRAALGDTVFHSNGRLDKARTASIIFGDRQKREALEGILHPIVLEGIDSVIDKTAKEKGRNALVVVEIPLLFEKGIKKRFDKTVTVFTNIETAVDRLKSSGISYEDAMMRLRVQMPIEEKIRKSDFAIDNSHDVSSTRAQVNDLYSRFVQEAKERCGKDS